MIRPTLLPERRWRIGHHGQPMAAEEMPTESLALRLDFNLAGTCS